VETSRLSPSAIKEFEKAAFENLIPLAQEFGFKFEQVDARLLMLTSETLSIKVYFPECHGYDVDVKITPTPSREWYAPTETSIFWVGPFLGLGDFATSRATSEEQIARLVKVNIDFLRQALPSLLAAKENFWDELSRSIDAQMEAEKERDRQWLEEKRLAEIRQKIEVAWQAKKYAEVISSLEEIKEKMTPAEIKKLQYARKHVV
jgi:hypothetical protein